METLSSLDSLCTSVGTSDSLTSSEFSYSGEDRQDNELPPQDTRTQWEVGELSPGSYCRYKCYPLENEQRASDWNPKASKGIVVRKGCKDCQWTIVSFFRNPKRFIQKMDSAANLCRERREQFILLEVLPFLEESWGRCSESNKDIYELLAKLSHSVSSGQVVRHSLRLLLHLICRDNFEKGHGSLLDLEEIMRSSIFSPQGVFRREKQSERTLKLFVYSRILLLLLRPEVRHGELLIGDVENDLKKIVEELRRHQKQVENKKKDTLRYSIELILALFSNSFLIESREISPKAERMEKFLEECQEFCRNPNKESKDLKILQTLKEKKKTLEWDELHFVLYYLHGKVHSERPTPQMETERRAMLLVRLIIEAYLNAKGGEDWRFCLATSQLLVEIVKNNVTKELRQEAGLLLIYLLRDKRLQKKPECRAIVEKWSSQVLFSPDPEIRKIMIHFMSQNQREATTLPVERHSEHLSSIYGTQTLEINGAIISQNQNCVIVRGMFQQQKVVIKILNVMKNHLLGEDPKFEARTRMMYEAQNLRRLGASSHPNFPVLLGFDTKSMPYHIITAFECWGNLRKFLQRRQDVESRDQALHLLKMLDGVVCALSHLEKLGLVHRCVNAENILVGDNFVCKLSGLHSLRRLTVETMEQDSTYDSLDTPLFVAKASDMDLPVRWLAPESLIHHHFSTASDVYSFGMLVYEVLTYGCTPYRNVLKDEEVSNLVIERREIVQKEDCFEDCEYMLIEQCCQWQHNNRPSFHDIRDQLGDIINQQSDESKGRPDPPPLKVDISASKYPIAAIDEELYDDTSGLEKRYDNTSGLEKRYDNTSGLEDLYEDISDIHQPPTLSSVEKIDDREDDLYEDLSIDFVQTKHQGSTEIRERLSQQDIQHVKELRCLNNPQLVPILRDELCRSFRWIVSRPNCTYGTLKEYVLRRECKKEHIVMFLSQIASVCHYLHSRHIVHGNLRAVYVYVESPDKVQVGGLGRSKSLPMSRYDVTSTLCVVEAGISPDARRWSSPEVNMDGYYSHASDVWAFGILAWELYQSFQHRENNQQFSIPYFWLDNDQILEHQRVSCPLDRPECCPDWVYILIHQCWAFKSEQRPPFLAIFDCLVSREPMNSWIMRRWLKTHKEEEYPDLSITQENDAIHVLPESRHPSEESIMRMCSPDFFSQHKYKYVERPIDFGLEESFEESGNPPESPAYDEPDRDHSQDCVAKVASSNEDLGYACLLNERMRSMCTENDTLNPLYEETTNLSGRENQNLEYARQNANLNETCDYAEVREIAGYHSRLGHNKNGAHIAANGFKYNNNKREGSEHGGCPSLSIVNEKQSGIPLETKYQCLRENKGKEKGETQSYQSETEVQEQEGDEEEIYEPVAPRADPNKNAILKEYNEAMKNALVEDGVNTSLAIRNKKPTGVSKETENQRLREHVKNQASGIENGETQGTPPKKRTKLQPGHEKNEGDNSVCIPMNQEDEEEIYGPIVPSADPNENAIFEVANDSIPENPEDEGKNARPGEICNQNQSVSQEENMMMTCSKEDDSGASTEDTPVTQTLSREKTKEDDHGAQSPLPTGEGTECEVPHRTSPFRRIRTIWKKRKTTVTNKQATRKAKNLENKENAAPGCGSETEIVLEQVPEEVNEQDRTEE
ncbi:uncharacterized protein LOC141866614 isoform X4 [Acropora palmata]